tara:strand:+ start:1125 stop:1358 length:234 start_codon:yes stop_codon:yes gene_type:complete
MAVNLEQAQQFMAAYQNRKYFYKKDSDPLMIKVQLGTATQDELVSARNAVKTRFPYPSGVTEAECIAFLQSEGVWDE